MLTGVENLNFGHWVIEFEAARLMSFIPYALASGAFAALASVFAKLFTDSKTAYFTQVIIDLLSVKQQDALTSYVSANLQAGYTYRVE
jgi:hypothetical protein